jgi:drug/metabolite transporter (DMT)-like permease
VGAALVWAVYSLMSKKLAPFPTSNVGIYCLISGFFSLLLFFLISGKISLPDITASDWTYLLLLGLGPMGAAFFAWDASLKRGDPRVIGALAYLTPLFSTLVLNFVGGYSITSVTVLAMVLIIAGALIGSKELFMNQKTTSR